MGHIIQNFEALAENEQRRSALSIAEAGYAAIDVGDALRRKLRIERGELQIDGKTYRLAERRVFFVGIGKCALAAVGAIKELFGGQLAGGIAFDASPNKKNIAKIETYIGTHPLPSEENEHTTERVMTFLSDLRGDDLVVMLISGGGSTLLCSYEAPMTYADESELFKELTAHGATIQEMNAVRKHTSRARGGGLARAAYPAEVIALIASDVPGNDSEFISSGPTTKDTSTIADAKEILVRYDVTPPENVQFIETPKDEKYFERVTNILFLTNRNALSAMRDEAARQGYAAGIVDEQFAGEARDVGRVIVEKLHTSASKTALLYGGESTVALDAHHGTGGRNQEMALAALEVVHPDELILPFASDGHDNTAHAGAIGDAVSFAHARAHGLSLQEYLNVHRSYDFFSTTGDALRTGYTGSNVSDLIIALKN
ncbi:MAG: DUF4147 domain-containing protein [Minisyncoccia bacterium]|jgi:glycerate-2-kinase